MRYWAYTIDDHRLHPIFYPLEDEDRQRQILHHWSVGSRKMKRNLVYQVFSIVATKYGQIQKTKSENTESESEILEVYQLWIHA